MTSPIKLLRAVLIATLAATFTANTLDMYATVALGVGLASLILYIWLFRRYGQEIVKGFSSIEARYGFSSEYDKKLWGIKPKYDDVKYAPPILGVLFGPYAFVIAIEIANGSYLPRSGKLIFSIFGTTGVVFVLALIGVIICSGTIEFCYYLWKRKQRNPS